MKKKQKKSDISANRGADLATTYFSYNGPTLIETSFSNPATAADDSSRRDGFVRDLESSPSEAAEKASTIPIRPRPLHDPQSLVLVAPPYSEPAYPGYAPLVSRFGAFTREPSDEFYITGHSRNPYRDMRKLKLKHMVIFMAAVFVVSLMVLVFVAVYFGRRLGPDTKA